MDGFGVYLKGKLGIDEIIRFFLYIIVNIFV